MYSIIPFFESCFKNNRTFIQDRVPGWIVREVWPIQVLEHPTQIPMQQIGDQVSICSQSRRRRKTTFAKHFCPFWKGTINGCGGPSDPNLKWYSVAFCTAAPALNKPGDCFAYPHLSRESIGSQIAPALLGGKQLGRDKHLNLQKHLETSLKVGSATVSATLYYYALHLSFSRPIFVFHRLSLPFLNWESKLQSWPQKHAYLKSIFGRVMGCAGHKYEFFRVRCLGVVRCWTWVGKVGSHGGASVKTQTALFCTLRR